MAGKKFQFKLDAVLRLRRRETLTARQHLAAALDAFRQAEEDLEATESALTALSHSNSGSSSLAAIRRAGEFLAEGVLRVEVARSRLEAAGNARESARGVLSARMQAEEAIEQLKTHQRTAFEEEEAKADQKVLDDLAVIGHVRAKQKMTA